jgi:hypothetical protein
VTVNGRLVERCVRGVLLGWEIFLKALANRLLLSILYMELEVIPTVESLVSRVASAHATMWAVLTTIPFLWRSKND